MATKTGIGWCDHTHNEWIGCMAVSQACDHCYAEAMVKRFGNDFATRRLTSEANRMQPFRWNRKAARDGVRRRVFCASMADVFDNKVSEEWRDSLWLTIVACQQLDWLLLTKRPQNIPKMLPKTFMTGKHWGDGWPNVWLGCTVENQTEAGRRIPHLRSVPSRVSFLSCEPLLGPINLNLEGISWVITGHESGRNRRETKEEWTRHLLAQCQSAGVPFFYKQAFENGRMNYAPLLDGREYKEFPV